MKNTKRNLGGLGFLLPSKNIETVKEEKETNENSAVKQKESSKGDNQKPEEKQSSG